MSRRGLEAESAKDPAVSRPTSPEPSPELSPALARSLALGEALRASHQTVATAESCTGGLVSAAITDAPGASGYFLGGVVSYSNAMKEQLLGVKTATLIAHGAVSQPCVEEMARGVRERIGASFGVAISGIAGPGGGTPEKPVGTVHFAVASEKTVIAKKFVFAGDREAIRHASVIAALELLQQSVAAASPVAKGES